MVIGENGILVGKVQENSGRENKNYYRIRSFIGKRIKMKVNC